LRDGVTGVNPVPLDDDDIDVRDGLNDAARFGGECLGRLGRFVASLLNDSMIS